MVAIGWTAESVSLDDREFNIVNGVGPSFKFGGLENYVHINDVSGTRKLRQRLTPWSIGGLVLGVDNSRGDYEFIRKLSNRSDEFPIAVTHASGITYQGTGVIIGGVRAIIQNATVSVALMGSGELTRQ